MPVQTFGFSLDTHRTDTCSLGLLVATFLAATFLLLRYKGRD